MLTSELQDSSKLCDVDRRTVTLFSVGAGACDHQHNPDESRALGNAQTAPVMAKSQRYASNVSLPLKKFFGQVEV